MTDPHDDDLPGASPPPHFDGVDPLSADVLRAFMRVAHRQRQALHRGLARHDVHPAQASVLRMLATHRDLSQRDLADHLMLSRPTVTRVLQRMERNGLVERRADDADQRVTRVSLTEEGRALTAAMGVAYADYAARTVAQLPEEDRRQLVRCLNAWADHADDLVHCPHPGTENP